MIGDALKRRGKTPVGFNNWLDENVFDDTEASFEYDETDYFDE